VLPPTEENYAQQQKLRELANPIPAQPPKRKGGSEAKKVLTIGSTESGPKGVKRSRDFDVEKVPAVPTLSLITVQQSDFLSRPEIKLNIPDTLKSILVDDWENVTKHQQVCHSSCRFYLKSLCYFPEHLLFLKS
jgi:mortality factor 4-like protein 1